jgi:hypothetical protein
MVEGEGRSQNKAKKEKILNGVTPSRTGKWKPRKRREKKLRTCFSTAQPPRCNSQQNFRESTKIENPKSQEKKIAHLFFKLPGLHVITSDKFFVVFLEIR